MVLLWLLVCLGLLWRHLDVLSPISRQHLYMSPSLTAVHFYGFLWSVGFKTIQPSSKGQDWRCPVLHWNTQLFRSDIMQMDGHNLMQTVIGQVDICTYVKEELWVVRTHETHTKILPALHSQPEIFVGLIMAAPHITLILNSMFTTLCIKLHHRSNMVPSFSRPPDPQLVRNHVLSKPFVCLKDPFV